MASKKVIDALIAKMQHCPICGTTLTWFGTKDGDYKNCPAGCGIMKVHGRKQGQLAGMLFEVSEE